MSDAEAKKQLLTLKADIQQQEDDFQKDNKPLELDQARLGRLSRMDAMQVQQMALETSRRRVLQLSKIHGALQRIESGDYGFCFICGEELDKNRLVIDPTVTRCMSCVDS
ncbi:MAG TPA: TraR/DksA family transcriptional regulator [Cycloclasticus sp.]|jgi:DnaK suppressor protein|nr:TraR/DksA family transcriptional regulator [Cycloclasticus sp.]HIL92553.1 TraR/DksA family transcriptional regulator [Cycloclasticus sp.]